MKQLPEAARVIVERARDAHDPSEAQLQNMLANLHAQLGYAAAPSEPAGAPEAATAAVGGARGLLHAKLLKLVLSLAAIGGIAALVAPRVWNHEPAQPPAVVIAPVPDEPAVVEYPEEVVAEREHNAAAPPVSEPIDRQALPARGVQQEKSARKAVVSRRPLPASRSGSSVQSGTTLNSAVGAEPTSADVPGTGVPGTDVTEAGVTVAGAVVAAPKVAAEKVLLSDDVVPLQSARKRAAEKASGPSDADELQMIGRAASLLRDGEPEEALELLQEHGRKFPESQLKLERRGLSVLARCGAGQIEQGRRERDEFLRDASKAPISARVRKACPERQP